MKVSRIFSGSDCELTSYLAAKLLLFLGLNRYPPLIEMMRLMSGEDVRIRQLALKYFFEKFASQYSDYTADQFAEVAFIPAIRPDGTEFLAKHSEVFAEKECADMGFAFVQPSIRDDALSKLRISLHPPSALVVSVLIRSPPKDKDTARRNFEYLTNILGCKRPSYVLVNTT